MTYHPGKCVANCSFCPQANSSNSKSLYLSRISWPEFPSDEVFVNLKESYKNGLVHRVCIQALNYSDVFKFQAVAFLFVRFLKTHEICVGQKRGAIQSRYFLSKKGRYLLTCNL